MGKRSGRLLAAMERPATVVLRYGTTTHRIALWALEQPSARGVRGANRRLAFQLEAQKLSTTPDFMALPPGALFRRPRAIPEPVAVSRAVLRTYVARRRRRRPPDRPEARMSLLVTDPAKAARSPSSSTARRTTSTPRSRGCARPTAHGDVLRHLDQCTASIHNAALLIDPNRGDT
jgi:hypothetical protein